MSYNSGGGGSGSIHGGSDVFLNNPTTGDALVYSGSDQKWKNGGVAASGVAYTNSSSGLISATAQAAIDELNIGVVDLTSRDFVWVPNPLGIGIDDTPNVLAAITKAEGLGSGIAFRSGDYRLLSQEILIPDKMSVIGSGMSQTTIYMNTNGALRFGVIDGSGARRFPVVRDFTLHGTNQSVSPLRIGHITGCAFTNIQVMAGSSSGPGILVETAQNTVWTNMQVVQNAGDGIRWDLGTNNHILVGCIVSNNGQTGHVFTQSRATPPGTSTISRNNNFHIIGGLCEGNNVNQVRIEAGSALEWIGAQMSGESTNSNPSLYISDQLNSNINQVIINGGQIKPGAPTSTGAQVDAGILYLHNGVNLRSAGNGIMVGDNGRVIVSSTYNQNTPIEYAASGTQPIRNLVQRALYSQSAMATGNTTFVSNANQAPIAGLTAALVASAEYDFELFLVVSGSTSTDLAFSWQLPTGATMNWTHNALPTGSPAASGTPYCNEATTVTSALTSASRVVRATGTIFNGSTAGTITLTAAQATSSGNAVTVSQKSRLRITRTV